MILMQASVCPLARGKLSVVHSQRSGARWRSPPGGAPAGPRTACSGPARKITCGGAAATPPGSNEDPGSSPQGTATQSATPAFWDGVNLYCYAVLTLLFLTDMTPLGMLVRMSATGDSAGATAAIWLAGLQWGCFVCPMLWIIRERGWSWRETLLLKPTGPVWVLGSAAAGAVLWAAVAWALATKSGVSLLDPSLSTAGAQSVLGQLVQHPSDAGQWAQLLLAAGASPAAAEELLFRGLLLTALRDRLGKWDAVFVCGALFAASHLDPQQFFALAMLGIAAGGATVTAGSVIPAVALHLGFNSAALAAGGLLVAAGSSGV